MVWRNWSCTNKTIWTQRKSQEKYKEKLQLWDLWRYLLHYDMKLEKRKKAAATYSTDWLTDGSQPKYCFWRQPRSKEKGFIGKSRQKEELSKGWRPAKPFSSVSFTSEFMTTLLRRFPFCVLRCRAAAPPDWCRKGEKASLFQSLKKLQGAEARKEKSLSKANRRGLKSKKNFC